METLLKLGLSLLCIEIALALRCRQCRGYTNMNCHHRMETCFPSDGESCMIRRVFSSDGENKLQSAESKCVKDCQSKEDISDFQTVVTTCCSGFDFCNDIDVPIMLQ
uniref:UPAR/Ly6 domain-containing protein n=1 Tax=Oryctolagus cuniculus TaxID=9986 RepID=A0A5F9D6H5_RABIT|nr:uncharacterized protein LOC103348989 [Oryctolagus cuniculus]